MAPATSTVNGTAPNGSAVNGSTAHGVNGSTNNGVYTNDKETNEIESCNAETELVGPIAICGMACRLPGALHSPEQFWDFLIRKGDAKCRVPASRYNIDGFLAPTTGKTGTINTEYGYFLDESVDLATLDTSFFSMRRNEVDRADPQQRQLLEVVRECMEDAGETNWRGRNIGCYVGNFGEDWAEIFAKDPLQYGQYRYTGFGDFMLPNRISYEMDLRGPSIIIRTACSAATIALHEACQAIGRGDCVSAIVGGVNLILAPGMTTNMAEQGVLAADGSCKTFSADADGYARGEAVNALYIKPLAAAIRDGNPVRAVIRATASNSDGRSPLGGSAPNAEAQEALMRRAYELAGIEDLSKTGYVECHGTGTPVGDPIETDAVARVFGADGVYITSVKPNLGHSEGASGITSVMKAVLSLQHQTIPPNIKFSSPSSKIPWEAGKLKVPLEPTPWPDSRAERVSVNSFGIGGSNAHIIIDSARSFNIFVPSKPTTDTPQLLVYSANAAESLKQLTANYSEFVEKHPESIGDLTYTLSNRREHLPHRAFAIANRYGSGTVSLIAKVGQPPNVVMVFTGQGAQWPLMGREFLRNPEYSVFKDSIRALDKHLQAAPFAPEWLIEEELLKPVKTSRMHTAELSQPLCTALQIALVDNLASVGIKPSAVIGHSSGEIAAAYAVGALTANDAIMVAFHRGQVTKRQTKAGAMAAIGIGWNDVEKFLVPGVRVACENSPKSVTLSGDADKVEAVVAVIRESEPEVLARMLKVDKAYHSHHMAEIGDDYHALIENIVAGDPDPTQMFFSSVTGNVLTEGESLGARYWQKNLESPVLFSTAVASILQHEVGKSAVFLEIGPHSALAGPLRQTQAQYSNSAPYVSTMNRGQNGIETFLTAIGKLYTLNVRIDFRRLIPNGATLSDLPRYPWNHSETFWYESRLSKEWRHRQHVYHELLGIRVPESTKFDPAWRNLFHLDNASWIRDHKLQGDIVFPFVAYAGMIGEAARQVSGVQEGFTLRHVVVSSALVLTEGKPTEMVTTFRRHRLTDHLDSQWWEFTIASYNDTGHVWMKHCSGQVKGQAESLGPAKSLPSTPRKVSSRRCYESIRQSGLDFGPSFQLLKEVSSATTEQLARARADAVGAPGSGRYHLHPTLIDTSLQLLIVASTKGFAHQGRSKMLVPTAIKELSVYNCATGIEMMASASFTGGGNIDGEVESSAQGQTVLRISGLRLTALGEDDQDGQSETTARAEWGPHIDFLDAKSLIQPSIDRALTTPLLNELSKLGIVHSQRQGMRFKPEAYHLNLYHAWIDRQAKSSSVAEFAQLSDEAIEKRVNSLVSQLSNSPAVDAATAIFKIFSHIKEIFTGGVEPLELLLADNTLNNLYQFTDEIDRSLFLQHAAHSKPNLRVLEIGAGTGASTRSVLKDLAPSDERILYSKYTFTDISSGLFVAAKENFKAFPNMEYAALDISKDPAEQGFEGRQFDLILATNVIHATKTLRESLENIQKLLHPQGRLLLTELNPSSKWVNYIWGTLQGWWFGEHDGRTDEPYVTPERWQKELVAAGFDGLDAIQLDSEEPHQLNATMVARPRRITTKEKRVTLLCFDKASTPGPIFQQLERKGYAVTQYWLDDTPLPAGQDIIALLDKDQPFFAGINDGNFEAFKRLISSISGSGVMWITRLSQMHCADPRWAQTIGIARTIRSEFLIPFATCEVDDLDACSDLVVDVFSKFHLRADDDNLDPDFEYAIQNRVINVGRVYPYSLQKELLTSEPSDKVFLHTDKPGRVGDLHWSRAAVYALEGDAVEVDMHSTGLNFKDVLCAMGIVEPNEEGFGLEGSGTVRRVGPNVKNLHVGDRVMLIGHCLFANLATSTEERCVKIPDNLDFDDAATMPCVYTTSIYSLFNVGCLRKGQSILIHSACGGVGIASIQLAKMAGAEIYVTVGNEEKVQYLVKTFNLPRNRIFNSRNTSFVADLVRETNGKGVDLALNSLSGELLHATWECIAEFGKMIEIGKRDLLGAGKLDLAIFLDNRSYCCVDLDQICFKKPALCQELLQTTIGFLQAGHILPIRPTKIFDAASIHDAFRYMQQGQHLGKIVISIHHPSKAINFGSDISERTRLVKFDDAAHYLLVGGLGGLGRSVSTWMVERGARHLIYLSRSAGATSAEHQDFIHELESMGCQVQLVQGSVSNPDDVMRAVELAQGHLKGILQMSMVLRDQALTKMTLEEWNAAVLPKVAGTWNLHNATLSTKLDFFVLFSSISGLMGQPGQANYAGANTFLDAFVHYRNGLGLPISAVDIGAVEEVGYVSRNEGLLRRLKNSGALGMVSEQDLLDSMAAVMTCLSTKASNSSSNASRFITINNFALGLRSAIPLSSPDNRAPWRRDIRMAIFYNSGIATKESTKAASNVLKAFLAKAKNDPSIIMGRESITLLATEIGKKLFSFLLKPEEDLQISLSLADLGMDSLVAIEMRSWWKQTFAFEVKVLEMMGMGTLEALGQHAAEGLLKQHSPVESEEASGSN